MLNLDLAESTNLQIWAYVSRNDCVVISKDEDLLYLANVPQSKARFTKTLLAAIERLWPKIEARMKAGDRIIELR